MFSGSWLEQYPQGADVPDTDILILGGGARSGKGETGNAITEALEADGRSVEKIDQGLKFRSLAYMAIAESVDMDEPEQIDNYLGAATTPVEMLSFLGDVKAKSEEDQKAMLYTGTMGAASGKVGASCLSHGLAVDLMFREVEQARDEKKSTVIIDGRSLDKYAVKMDRAGLGVFIGSFFLQCDPLIAAKRVLKDFRDPKTMEPNARDSYLEEALRISDRNHADAIRKVDPLRYPHHAFSLDLLRGLPGDQQTFRTMMEMIIKTKIISVNTSHTETIPQMTRPIVAITQYMLDAANLEREQWQRAQSRRLQSIDVV